MVFGKGFAILVLLFLVVNVLNSSLPLLDNIQLRTFGYYETGHNITAKRDRIWRTGWSLFLARPVLGYGLESHGIILIPTGYPNEDASATHNTLLWALLEGGITGVVLLLMLLVVTGVALIKRVKEKKTKYSFYSRSCYLALLSIFASSFVFGGLNDIQFNKFFWLIIALAGTTVGADEPVTLIIKAKTKQFSSMFSRRLDKSV